MPIPAPAPVNSETDKPATPEANDDALMASAVKSLVSSEDEKPAPASGKILAPPTAPTLPDSAPTAEPTGPAVTPAAPTEDATEDDGVTVAHKKIISPITNDSTPHQPDLNELLAKEGFTPDDIHNGPTNPQTGLPTAPHPPGHVISPNPAGTQPGNVDPNSIAL